MTRSRLDPGDVNTADSADGRDPPRVVYAPLSAERVDGRGGFNDPETGTWIPCVTEGEAGADGLCVIDSAALGALGEADAALVHRFAAVAVAQDAVAAAGRAVERAASLGGAELPLLRDVVARGLARLSATVGLRIGEVYAASGESELT